MQSSKARRNTLSIYPPPFLPFIPFQSLLSPKLPPLSSPPHSYEPVHPADTVVVTVTVRNGPGTGITVLPSPSTLPLPSAGAAAAAAVGAGAGMDFNTMENAPRGMVMSKEVGDVVDAGEGVE